MARPDAAAAASQDDRPPTDGPRLTPSERLREVFRRMDLLPRGATAEETFEQLRATLEEVEDEYSGVERNPNPGLKFDGRMYPPRDDHIRRDPDGGLFAQTKGHDIHISPDGALRIVGRATGNADYQRLAAKGE